MSLFHRTFPSELNHVRPILLDALGYIKTELVRFPEDEEYDLRLVLSELLCNAVIHGNGNDRRKIVTLSLDVKGGVVFCAISDEGDGFDHAALMRAFNSTDDCESEHGRGIRIANALTDKLRYNVSGNTIHFEKRVAADA